MTKSSWSLSDSNTHNCLKIICHLQTFGTRKVNFDSSLGFIPAKADSVVVLLCRQPCAAQNTLKVGQSSYFISSDIRCISAYSFAPVLQISITFLRIRNRLSSFQIQPFILAVLRIRDVYPESEFFPSRIQVKKIPGSRSASASKNLCILTQKIVSKLSEIWSKIFIPDTDLYFFSIPDPGSKGQQLHRILDPDLQYCILGSCLFWRFLVLHYLVAHNYFLPHTSKINCKTSGFSFYTTIQCK